MKLRNAVYVLATVFLVLSVSCKKDSTPGDPYKCTTCKTTPDALAANDASSKGVYKGVVIGSTGTIYFNIANNGSTINAVMVLDNVSTTLTASVSWVAGISYVSPFTGTINGSPVVITFQVDANGQNPVILTSSIPGHPSAQFTLVKELSTSLIECFEGTYTSTRPETGTFNLLLSRSLGRFGGSSRETGSTTSEDIDEGTIDASGNLISNGQPMGHLDGDVITGTFHDSQGNAVTINAHRTL